MQQRTAEHGTCALHFSCLRAPLLETPIDALSVPCFDVPHEKNVPRILARDGRSAVDERAPRCGALAVAESADGARDELLLIRLPLRHHLRVARRARAVNDAVRAGEHLCNDSASTTHCGARDLRFARELALHEERVDTAPPCGSRVRGALHLACGRVRDGRRHVTLAHLAQRRFERKEQLCGFTLKHLTRLVARRDERVALRLISSKMLGGSSQTVSEIRVKCNGK